MSLFRRLPPVQYSAMRSNRPPKTDPTTPKRHIAQSDACIPPLPGNDATRSSTALCSSVLNCPHLLWINLQSAVWQDMNFCRVRETTAEVAPFVPLPPRDEVKFARAIANQFASVVGAGRICDERFVGERAVRSSKLVSDQVVCARPAPGPRGIQPRGR